MGMTAAVVHKGITGDRRLVVADLTFDDDYTNGGEPLTAGDLGMSRIIAATLPNLTGRSFEYDISGEVVTAWHSDLSESTDGPLVELTDASSALDGDVVRGIFIGT